MNQIRSLVSRTAWRSHTGAILLALGVLATLTIWLSLDAYQSHFISGLRTLGDTTTQSIIGVPKEGRGDEWSTYLPILKQAYHEGFPQYSNLKPYFEKLDWFIAIPHFDLSLLFLPNYTLYWILPGGLALSFQGFYYNAIFIVSTLWLLANLGVRRRYALACAFMLLCSQFYQVWWTSNFPVLGLSLLPFAVFTSQLRRPYKFVLLAWCIAHMLFGEMYPPFIVSIALALAPLVLAARPDLLNTKDLLFAAIAGAVALACYLALNWGFFEMVSHTSYPGSRLNTGGGSTVRSLLALVFPTLPANAKGGDLENLYTLAVAGTILPLLFLSFVPQIRWDRRAIRLTIVFVIVATFCVVYMLIGIPREIALLSGLYMVPGPRMAVGISLLIAFYSVIMMSWNIDAFSPIMLVMVATLYVCVSFVGGGAALLSANFFAIQDYQWILLSVVSVCLVYYFLSDRSTHAKGIALTFTLCVMTCTQIIVYGSFNPIMHAADILRPVHSQVINDWRALYKKNGDKPFGTIGHYGDLLRGENLPALEAIHLANVKPARYQKVFPSLTAEQIHDLFNQFRGIAFANIAKRNAGGATVVFPIKPYAVSFANVVKRAPPGADVQSLSSGHTTVASGLVRPGMYLVRWNTSLLAPLPIQSMLVLHLSCGTGASWVTRYPIVLPNKPVVPVALQGVAGQIEVRSRSQTSAEQCVSHIRVTAVAESQASGAADVSPASIRSVSVGRVVGGFGAAWPFM